MRLQIFTRRHIQIIVKRDFSGLMMKVRHTGYIGQWCQTEAKKKQGSNSIWIP